MRLSELLYEKKKKEVHIMYHGTTDEFLRSILKQGLLSNPPNPVFSRDSELGDEPRFDTLSGGVYFTDQWSHAREIARHAVTAHGGEPIIIKAQLVVGSEEIDEDDITSILYDLDKILPKNTTVVKFLKSLSNPAIKQSVAEKFIELFSNSKSFKELSDYVKNVLINMFNYIIKSMHNVIVNKPDEFFVKHYGKDEDTSTIKVSYSFVSDLLDFVRHDPEFENLLKQLVRQLKRGKTNTTRIPRTIGFSGKNRILAIYDEQDNLLYPRKSQSTKKLKMPDVEADYYFIGNVEEEYAWGSGTDYNDLMSDAKSAYDDFLSMDPSGDDWEEELSNLKIYPTDEYTYNYIRDVDGIASFVKKGDLFVIEP